ncbi:hypothetical protein NEA10_07670 [Phormidium yuhuli AB48]|uniref:Lipoprotein n=1 Tax=Phormidium yuhuli AB48 TaxID=2940671 RepID=A0ABY5AV30_9CYAN|nr:hypothetical protein [Phormidium yuhuli]USR92586.1 hypothetical protein NEA10_07670 [Phormidium yuhuli AB48]
MRNKALLLLLTLPLIACNSVEVNEDLAQGNAEEEVQEAPMAELEEGEARVSISLMFPDEEFGATSDWEASLYMGAEPGEETSGRFTDWKSPDEEGLLQFMLPEEVREDETAPFGEEGQTYVRLRSLDDAYPSFDIVSEAFTLTEGSHQVDVAINSLVISTGSDWLGTPSED